VRKRSREENRDRPRPLIETFDLAGVVFEIGFVTQLKKFLIKVNDRTNRDSFGRFFAFMVCAKLQVVKEILEPTPTKSIVSVNGRETQSFNLAK